MRLQTLLYQEVIIKYTVIHYWLDFSRGATRIFVRGRGEMLFLVGGGGGRGLAPQCINKKNKVLLYRFEVKKLNFQFLLIWISAVFLYYYYGLFLSFKTNYISNSCKINDMSQFFGCGVREARKNSFFLLSLQCLIFPIFISISFYLFLSNSVR